MLKRVEEASPGIAARSLPARDGGAGRLVELSIGLGVEPESGQPPLHVATLPLVESDLSFGFASCLVGKALRIDGCRHVADGRARTRFGSIRTDENAENAQD